MPAVVQTDAEDFFRIGDEGPRRARNDVRPYMIIHILLMSAAATLVTRAHAKLAHVAVIGRNGSREGIGWWELSPVAALPQPSHLEPHEAAADRPFAARGRVPDAASDPRIRPARKRPDFCSTMCRAMSIMSLGSFRSGTSARYSAASRTSYGYRSSVPMMPLSRRLQRNDVLPVGEHDATKRDLAHVFDDVADHDEGVGPGVAVRRDVMYGDTL